MIAIVLKSCWRDEWRVAVSRSIVISFSGLLIVQNAANSNWYKEFLRFEILSCSLYKINKKVYWNGVYGIEWPASQRGYVKLPVMSAGVVWQLLPYLLIYFILSSQLIYFFILILLSLINSCVHSDKWYNSKLTLSKGIWLLYWNN